APQTVRPAQHPVRKAAGGHVVRKRRRNVSKRHVVTGLAIGLASVACVPRAHAAGQSCEQLAQLNLSNTTITSAETVAAGAFTPPAHTTLPLATSYKMPPSCT